MEDETLPKNIDAESISLIFLDLKKKHLFKLILE